MHFLEHLDHEIYIIKLKLYYIKSTMIQDEKIDLNDLLILRVLESNNGDVMSSLTYLKTWIYIGK